MKSNLQIILSIIFSLLIIKISLAQVPFGAPVIVENHWWNNNNVTIENEGPIISPGTPTSGVTIQGNSHVTFKSGSEIKLEPGFTTNSLTGNGYFHAQIEKSDFDVVAMNASAPDFEVGQFEKLELGIKLPDNLTEKINNYLNGGSHGINPYDPDKISVEATFTNGSTSKVIYGFYFKDFTENLDLSSWNPVSTDYPWRIRFAPPETGNWYCSIKVTSPLGLFNTLEANDFLFLCVPSNNKGYLEMGPYCYQLRFTKLQEPFFAIGQNIPWTWYGATKKAQPCHFEPLRNHIINLQSNGGNYFRNILPPWSTAVEWEKIGDYDINQPYMWELDGIFELAHSLNMYIHLCLEMHCQYVLKVNHTNEDLKDYYAWENNPYKTGNQNIITGINYPIDFFTSTECKNYFKKRLRYIVARWGYSTNLATYELFSEIDQIEGYKYKIGENEYINFNVQSATYTWHNEMALYIKSNLDANHLITTSYSGNPTEFSIYSNYFYPNAMDISSNHRYYDPEIDNNYVIRYNDLVGEDHPNGWSYYPLRLYFKPYIIGEMAEVSKIPGVDLSTDDCSDNDFHNRLWATTFMGGFGTGLNWYKSDDDNFRGHFKPLSSFINSTDLNDNYIYPQRSHGTGKKETIASFSLINENKEKAIGWVQNRSNWTQVTSWTPFNCNRYILSVKSKLEVTGLEKNKKYIIEFYTTNPSLLSAYISSHNDISNAWGTIKTDVSGFLSASLYKDVAFKIHLDDDKSIINSTYFDTLDCPLDTLIFNDIYKDDISGTKYQYYWDFGNGATSNTNHPEVYYSKPGIYLVTCIVNDLKGISDTLYQYEIVPDCENHNSTLGKELIILNELSGINIYPNPNNGIFSILSNNDFDGQISLYNAFGSEIMKQTIIWEKNTITEIDLHEKSKGIYFIRLTNVNDQQYIFKIIYN